MSDFDNKILQLKDIYKVKKHQELADKLGVSVHTINTWKQRKALPKKIELILSQNELLNNIDTVEKALNGTNMVSVNYYKDIYASAGYGANNEELVPIKMEFDKNFLEKILNIRRFDNLDIIRVVGDSMLPYIKDGEFIIVERGSDAKSGDTVIANIEGELYVKRLKKVPFEKWLTLESENNEYPSIELDTLEKLEAFTIIGVMRSKIKLY